MPSNNLDKYEYLTGEDLGLKPSTVDEVKLEYSLLGKIFNKGLKEEDKKEGLLKRLENFKDKNEELTNVFSKAPKNKMYNKNKRNKTLVYNSQHSFVKFKNISEFEKLSFDTMHKKLKSFHKQFTSLKNVAPRTKDNENKKKEVLNNAEDLYNELYYIYKDKYIEKENNLNKKKFKNLITKN